MRSVCLVGGVCMMGEVLLMGGGGCVYEKGVFDGNGLHAEGEVLLMGVVRL